LEEESDEIEEDLERDDEYEFVNDLILINYRNHNK
jgi:hypothetical protein